MADDVDPLEAARAIVERVGRPNKTRGAGVDAQAARYGVTLHNQALAALVEHADGLERRLADLEGRLGEHRHEYGAKDVDAPYWPA